MSLSIVIVNYNTGELLEQCLTSIEEKIADVPVQVIVVDNASTDGSENAARKRENVTLVAGDRNIGFASGCNAGVRVAGGDYLLFLNPDTRIITNGISELLKRFDSMENAGALGCQNLLPNGEIQTTAYKFPGVSQIFFFVFKIKKLLEIPGLKILLAPFLKEKYGQFDPHGKFQTVDWVTGAFLLVKREAWKKVGNMDQRFFLFCEEIDWCLRLKKEGMATVFDPSFEIEHHVGYSSEKVKPLVLLEKYRSYLKYFEKHRSPIETLTVKIIMSAGIYFWSLAYWLLRDKDGMIAYRGLRLELEI